MNIPSASNGLSSANLQEILAEAENAFSDSRKDAKITRQLHHDKNMLLLDQNIGSLKDQASQLGKAGWLNFIVGVVSNLAAIATQVIGILLPGVGAFIASVVNQVIQGVGQAISALDPFGKKARAAGIQGEDHKKNAENESKRFGMEDERLRQMETSQQTFKNRMEKSMEQLEKAQEAAVRS